MNKYECHCSDTDCILQSNKRPTFCTYYSHISPDWQLVVDEFPNFGKRNYMEELTPWDKLPQWIKDGIKNELRWACEKHPKYPDDPFHAMCLIKEEFGEAVKALNNLKDHNIGYINDVYCELLHTIVTCIRTLDTMAKNESKE